MMIRCRLDVQMLATSFAIHRYHPFQWMPFHQPRNFESNLATSNRTLKSNSVISIQTLQFDWLK